MYFSTSYSIILSLQVCFDKKIAPEMAFLFNKMTDFVHFMNNLRTTGTADFSKQKFMHSQKKPLPLKRNGNIKQRQQYYEVIKPTKTNSKGNRLLSFARLQEAHEALFQKLTIKDNFSYK